MSVPAGDGNPGPRQGWMAGRQFFMHRFEEATLALLRVVHAWRERRHNGRNLRRI